jgi:hypothetical protein
MEGGTLSTWLTLITPEIKMHNSKRLKSNAKPVMLLELEILFTLFPTAFAVVVAVAQHLFQDFQISPIKYRSWF